MDKVGALNDVELPKFTFNDQGYPVITTVLFDTGMFQNLEKHTCG